MLSNVMDALGALPRFPGVTLSDCLGAGRGRGPGGQFVAAEQTIGFHKMAKLELSRADALGGKLARVIPKAAHTGNAGDGAIMTAELPRVVRIRTGQEQDEAA